MRHLSSLFCLLACSGFAFGELYLDVDPETFPLYWTEDIELQMDALIWDPQVDQYYSISAVMSGPGGFPQYFHAYFGYDEYITHAVCILELRLTLHCSDEAREYVASYAPYWNLYLPGMCAPPAHPTPFPIHPLEFCPPYFMETAVTMYQGHTYSLFVNHEENSWDEIKRIAYALDAELVSISNQVENAFAQNLLHELPAWIGLTDEEEEGVWVWHNGEPLSYTNWAAGHPDIQDTTADYAIMDLDGTWISVDPNGYNIPAHVLLEWGFQWPIVIDDLQILVNGANVVLSWSVPDNVSQDQLFEVHFSQNSYFEHSSNSVLGVTSGIDYTISIAELPSSHGWFKLVTRAPE